jgi:hypothetical protein
MAAIIRNRFYSHAALVLAVFLLGAFLRTYYLRFLSDLPPLTLLIHVHGLLFTAWVLLFVAQTRLIAANRVDLHKRLGLVGIALAAAVFAVGIVTALEAGAAPGLRASGRTGAQFIIIPLTSITLFAALVGSGIALRKRPALHKRLMLLGMISVLGPAVARLVSLIGQGQWMSHFQIGILAAFVAWFLIADWRRHRIVHPVFLIGGLGLLLSWPLRLAVGASEWWQPIGRWLVGLV